MEFVAKITEVIEKTTYDDLPKEVIESAKLFVLDTIGVGIAGSKEPGCREVVEFVTEMGGTPQATVMSYGGKFPAPWATLANSTMMHALDFDDTLDESPLHANVTVLPTVLAMAEAKGKVTGKEVLTALVLGVDVVCRIGMGTTTPLAFVRTATCGSFGAAAAAAKVLGLTQEQIINALGIVYSQTAGNTQCLIDGGLVKRMQPALAAKAGVVSALLAQKGLTGARDVIEGDYGYYKLYERDQWNRAPLFDGLGERFEGMLLSLKPYPTCRITHSSIDAAVDFTREHTIDPATIEKVTVYASQMSKDMVGKPFEIRHSPQVDAQFSIPYTVAVALSRGDVFLNDIQEEAIRDPKILELAKKIEVVVDPTIQERSMMQARIEVQTKDNRSFSHGTTALRGNPLRPLTIEECRQKYRKCVAFSGSERALETADELIDQVTRLEEVTDIGTFMGLLV